MDGLELNKLAAAFLIALLLFKGGQEAGKLLVSPKELKEGEHAYIIEGIDATASTVAGPSGPLPIEPLLASANIERGATLVKQCRQCHTLEKGGANGIGPNLYGIVGDKIGRANNFPYSRTLASMEGKWTFENLSKLLFRPRDFINGTKMAFAGLRKEQDRADLIAYLNSLSDHPLALPKPEPATAPETQGNDKPNTPAIVTPDRTIPDNQPSIEKPRRIVPPQEMIIDDFDEDYFQEEENDDDNDEIDSVTQTAMA